jgi:hypothetical protein
MICQASSGHGHDNLNRNFWVRETPNQTEPDQTRQNLLSITVIRILYKPVWCRVPASVDACSPAQVATAMATRKGMALELSRRLKTAIIRCYLTFATVNICNCLQRLFYYTLA